MCIAIIINTFIICVVVILLVACIAFFLCGYEKRKCGSDKLIKDLKEFIKKVTIITFISLFFVHLLLLAYNLWFRVSDYNFSIVNSLSLIIGTASFIAACSIAFFQKRFAEKQDNDSNMLQKAYNDDLMKYRCICFIHENGFISNASLKRINNKFYIIINYNNPPVIKKDSYPHFHTVDINYNNNKAILELSSNNHFSNTNSAAIEINNNDQNFLRHIFTFLANVKDEKSKEISLDITLHFKLELNSDNTINIAISTTLYNTGKFKDSLFPTITVGQQYVVLE